MAHRILVFNTKEEWLNKRVIGGSSASAIIGKNPYMTNRELWDKLVHRNKKEEDTEVNEITQVGIDSEDYIRKLFAIEHKQYKVIPPKKRKIVMYQHKHYDFLTATLDGELIDLKTKEKGILEIKTQLVNGHNKDKWRNHIPDNYYIQVLHYMLVDSDYKFAIIHCRQRNVNDDGSVYITEIEYIIRRKDVEKDLDYLLRQEIDFWDNYVKKGIQPPLNTDFVIK